MTTSKPVRPVFPGLPLWILLSFCPSLTTFWARPDAWYAALAKPAWNPPNWVFGPVWTTLYVLMGTAAWLVWRQGGFAAQRTALLLFMAQLVLNALWTPLFFGLHSPGLALAEIIVLLVAVSATIHSFRRVSPLAAALLVPYLAWGCFATALTFTLWRMN